MRISNGSRPRPVRSIAYPRSRQGSRFPVPGSRFSVLGSGSDLMTSFSTLHDRIRTRSARVGVIGLGYVGLPLAVEFARAGFTVAGFDVDASKIAQINAGKSYIPDVPA